MKTNHKFHNPMRLSREQYGADQGWRLLTKEEAKKVPAGSYVLHRNGLWSESCNVGKEAATKLNYRTMLPLP